jgi:MscS family membrane protein
MALDVAPHPNEAVNYPDFPPRVYFDALNADSFNILVIYWYHPPDRWKYLEHAQWINMQIVERFENEGISFAFPTQTLYIAADEKRPFGSAPPWGSDDDVSPGGGVGA